MSPRITSGVRLFAQDCLDVGHDPPVTLEPHGWVLDAFLEDLTRIAVRRPRNDAAEIGLVRDARAKRDQLTAEEGRGHDRDVHRVRDPAEVRVVCEEGISGPDIRAEIAPNPAHDLRKRGQVRGRDHVLADDVAARVQEHAARILRLADDGGVTGPEDAVLHLPDDPGEPALDDLKRNRIDVHEWSPRS
jgi:hypothetical protein